MSEREEVERNPRRGSNRGKPRFFRRGGGGQKKPSNKPVSEEEAAATAVRFPVKKPTPIQSSDPFKPKNTGGDPTPLKNDPFFGAEVLFEGYGLTPYNEARRFELDASGFITLMQGSYLALTEFDRGLRKYLSFSMFQYYCTIGLWKRLWDVTSASSGENFQSADYLNRLLPEMTYPKEIAQYLDGIGDFVDAAGVRVRFHIHRDLNANIVIGGAQGSYDRVSGATHIAYETMPAPIVSLLKLQADYLYTNGGARDWNLPNNLSPVAADNMGTPTENLLGWKLAEKLTQEQLQTIEGAGMVLDQANLDFSVHNINALPVNVELLITISNLLATSKSPSTSKPTVVPEGTIGQMAYQVRDPTDHDINRKLITGKSMSLNSTHQLISGVTFLTQMFRYRVDRAYDDTYCYTILPNQNYPQGWIVTKNDVFTYGYAQQNWNRKRFTSAFTTGITNVGMLSRTYRTREKT